MSKYILLTLFAAAVLIIFDSCKKNSNRKPEIQAQLQGEWELRYLSISWWPDTTLGAGNGRRLAFFANNWYSNVIVQAGGTYTITGLSGFPATACGEEYGDRYDWKINLISGTDTTVKYVKLSGDTLLLRTGCFTVDGGRLEEYVRIADKVVTF